MQIWCILMWGKPSQCFFSNRSVDGSSYNRLLFDGEVLKLASHGKCLGLTINTKHNFNEHICFQTCKKISKLICIFLKHRHELPLNILMNLYYAFILMIFTGIPWPLT